MTAFAKQVPRDQQTIRRILKVNHAGEYGAIRIYRAQLWVARKFYPEIVPFLDETLNHEIEHCSLFQSAMATRKARPCRIMSLWGRGGFILGLFTALLGRQGVWICTSAVEATVHKHLEEQLHFLNERDKELSVLIRSIQTEELQHLDHANAHITQEGILANILRSSITIITEIIIWLSTWGDSTKMAHELKQANDK